MNKYPICIITKDRADICTTHLLLEPYGIKYHYMVEPQDIDSYKAKFGKKAISIEANDNGVAYARNYCIEWSKSMGYDMHWQLDDNIKRLFYRPMNHFKDTRDRYELQNPSKLFEYIEDIASRCVNYGAGSLSNDAFAFSKKRDIDVNKMVYCFQLINNHIKSRFQPNTSEDVDFSVRVLQENLVTMAFNKYTFIKPKSGSTKGGCNSSLDYKNNGRKKMNMKLCETYPGWFTEYTKNGKSEIKPSKIWSTFKQRPMTKK